MSEYTSINPAREQEILDGLFETVANLPEEAVFIGRLGLRVTLRGLTSSKVDAIRERCTVRKTSKGQVSEKIDSELFNAALIKEATSMLEVVKKAEGGDRDAEAQSVKLSGWGDERLTSRLKLSGGEEAVRRLLLAGELDAVGDKVLEISGFGVDIEDVKN
ncbi:phage tail assembly chaperone [Paenibacillus timonensis]|uniref:phage tail assembly chaperone n=1 Tax=Paenibacillus timonensis TaxID=225915 RepID=UPI003F9573E4